MKTTEVRKRYKVASVIRKLSKHLNFLILNTVFCNTIVEPKYRMSRALKYMVKSVDNWEARILELTMLSSLSTPTEKTDAVMDFLDTLVAFNSLTHALAFIDDYVLEDYEFDDTRVSEIPDHFLITRR